MGVFYAQSNENGLNIDGSLDDCVLAEMQGSLNETNHTLAL